MSNRVTTYLCVPKDVANEAERIARKLYFRPGDVRVRDDGVAEFMFYEVSYGNLPFLNELRQAGIAYDSSWETGEDISSGTYSLRFLPDGSAIEKSYYDDELQLDYDTLKSLVADHTDDDALAAAIRKETQYMAGLCEVPDWDNQAEYGKRYLAKQLLNCKDIA
jgi:hypothetical protein